MCLCQRRLVPVVAPLCHRRRWESNSLVKLELIDSGAWAKEMIPDGLRLKLLLKDGVLVLGFGVGV